MSYDVPTVRRCCLFVPLNPGILIYGIIRFTFAVLTAIMYVYFLIICNMISEIPLIVTVAIEVIVLLDIITITYFLYGYITYNVKYLAKFYPFCVSTLAIKILVYFVLAVVTKPILVIPYIICLLLDIYMIILVRTMMVESEREKGHCEFVNKLANPEQIVNIEVVNDSIPDMYKNRVYLVSDTFIENMNYNPEGTNKSYTTEDQKTVQKNTNEEKIENNDQVQPIPPITVTHM